MKYLVLSTSLDPDSRSRVLAREAERRMLERGTGAVWLDLAELEPILCDGATVWEHPSTEHVRAAVDAADGILLALGIYNYSASAAAKTAVELAGKAWTDKVVALACAAGGSGSFMAALPLANALMLDFRSVIVPRFVYATQTAFVDGCLADAGIGDRLDGLVADLVRMTEALRRYDPAS